MDLSDAFRQQVSFKEPAAASSAYGDPDFSTSQLQTANARVEPSTREVMNSQGQVVLSSHFVMMDRAVSVFARVWLPGADTSDDEQARRPHRVEPQIDLDGVTSHWEVYF